MIGIVVVTGVDRVAESLLCGYIKHGNKNEFGRIQNERGRGNDTGKAGYEGTVGAPSKTKIKTAIQKDVTGSNQKSRQQRADMLVCRGDGRWQQA